MKYALLTVAVAGLLSATPARAAMQHYDLDTQFGPVHLEIDDTTGHVYGNYPQYDGQIFGEVIANGDRIDGIWVQPGGDHPCMESRHDSRNWGRLIFENPRGNRLKGLWSYCSAEPTEPWNGHFR